MFLRAEGISGESVSANYQGWTAIASFRWGALQACSGGNATGKVAFRPLSVNAPIDKATSALLACCLSGRHIPTVNLAVCQAGNPSESNCLITLEDVQVITVNYDGINDGETLFVHYAFKASRVRQQYRLQSADGMKGPEVAFTWNMQKNCEE
ncbi:Hcp family type VI secretion system effector [Erwinia oleae]|uniref:Hcp family type VI secretion system effector n=1 Tax=Erwinia oleae TaxID=796334 RepID=UPI00054E5C26|nr:type VI secretion system tube protein Hcp [Erwinia oleae]